MLVAGRYKIYSAVSSVAATALYYLCSLLPGNQSRCLLQALHNHPVDKFKPHSYAIRGRATFRLCPCGL